MRRTLLKRSAAGVLYAVVVIGVVLAVWSVSAVAVGSRFIVPSVPETFTELGRVLKLRTFYVGLGHTLLRSVIGFVVSVAIAFLLFFLSNVSRIAAGLIAPVIAFFRTLPTMAVSLVLAIWAGANAAPVILGVTVIAPTVYSALSARTAPIAVELVEVARLCGAGRVRAFWYVTVPAAAAALPESLSAALSFNIKIVIAAEILMQTSKSMGMLMAEAQTYYMTATLIALVAAAVVVSVCLEFVVRGILHVLLGRYAD